jgi:hypothetical protein
MIMFKVIANCLTVVMMLFSSRIAIKQLYRHAVMYPGDP